MQYHPSTLNTDFKKYLLANSLSEATSRYYISDIRVFLRWVYQTTGDYVMSREMFESYEHYLKGSALPTKTINRKLSSLRIFNKYLLNRGFLREDVMGRVKNNPKSGARRYQIPQTIMFLILFGVIVVLGSILIAESSRNQGRALIETTETAKLPFVLRVSDSTKIPEVVNAESLNPITIEADDTIASADHSGNIVGRDSIPAGSVEKKIFVGSVTPTSIVFVTATTDTTPATIFVKEDTGFFTVKLSSALNQNITFNWLVVTDQFEVFPRQLPIDRIPN